MTSSEDDDLEAAAWEVDVDILGQFHLCKDCAAGPHFQISVFRFQTQRCERIPFGKTITRHEGAP